MSLMIVTGVAALVAANPVHSAEISHGANSYSATYNAASTVRFQQLEPRFANRPSAPVCRWQADLSLNRAVAVEGQQVAALGKAIHSFAPLQGSYAGPCAAARSQIDGEVTRYSQSRSAEAASIARQDQAILVNELDGIRSLAVKGG